MNRGSTALSIPTARIAEFCERHHIERLSLFGSVIRDDFGPESDVDVLVGSLISILEPVMVVVLGLIVGFIVVALFAPMIALIQSVSGQGKKSS